MLYDLTLICPFSRCQSPAPSVGLEQIKAGALTRLDKTRGKVNTGRNTDTSGQNKRKSKYRQEH